MRRIEATMAKRAPAEGAAAGAGAAVAEQAPPAQNKEAKPKGQAPSPRRIVDYYDREDFVEASRRGVAAEPVPALIRRVRTPEGAVDLCVFTDYGPKNLDAVPLADTPTPGHWSWPPTPK